MKRRWFVFVCPAVLLVGEAAAQAVLVPYIFNQDSILQDARFRIARTLANGQWVAEVQYQEAANQISTGGVWVHADPVDQKGAFRGVQADVAVIAPSNHPQEGVSNGTLAGASVFSAFGSFVGVGGVATATNLSNFASDQTSKSVGGYLVGGAPVADILTLDGVGTYWIGGAHGVLSGRIDGSAGTGAVSAVLGVDSSDPASTATTYAGYFQGDLRGTANASFAGDLDVSGGNLLVDSPTFPGRTYEVVCGSRQEVYAMNDLVTRSGSNIELQPTNAFIVADLGSTDFAVFHPGLQQAWIGSAGPQSGHALTVNGSACATGGFTTCSSIRFKENVTDLEDALGIVRRLRGVRYDERDTGDHEIGLIAEEVAQVLPEVVAFEEDGRALGLDYARLNAVLVEAIQEQQAQLDTLRSELARIQAELER